MEQFSCVRCGNCCRQGGDLRLLPEDLQNLAEYLGQSRAEVTERYGLKILDGRLYFLPFRDQCPFLGEDSLCSLHGKAKPFFCASYIPFVDTPGSPIYRVCAGIGQGRHWSRDEIQSVYHRLMERLVIRR